MMAWSDIQWLADSSSRNCTFNQYDKVSFVTLCLSWFRIMQHFMVSSGPPGVCVQRNTECMVLYRCEWCSMNGVECVRMSVLLLAITWPRNLKRLYFPKVTSEVQVAALGCGQIVPVKLGARAVVLMAFRVNRCEQMWTDVTMHGGSLWFPMVHLWFLTFFQSSRTGCLQGLTGDKGWSFKHRVLLG